MLARSLLFASANRPDLFRKFPQLNANLFALDLEDGTPAAERKVARANLQDSVRAARGERKDNLFVRINPAGSPDFAADLDAVQGSGADGIVLAKAERAEGFAADMGARRTPAGLEVLYARSQVVLAAKAARVNALDQVVLQLKDDALFRRDGTLGRDLGYDGKMCIHPRQVELTNELFAPTSAEIDLARRLVAAYEAARSRGMATIDFEGRMVDGPVAKTALSILVAAGQAS